MITISLLRDYLQLKATSDTTGNDTILAVSVESAVSEVENICNRKFIEGTYTDYISGNGCNNTFIRNYPLSSVSSIEVLNGSDWENLFTGSDSTSNSLFIIPEVNGFQLINGYVFPRGQGKNIKIIYNSGWEENECNGDIKGVLLEIASVFYFNSSNSGQARLGKSSENMSSTASTSSSFKVLYTEWNKRLSKYKIRKY